MEQTLVRVYEMYQLQENGLGREEWHASQRLQTQKGDPKLFLDLLHTLCTTMVVFHRGSEQ